MLECAAKLQINFFPTIPASILYFFGSRPIFTTRDRIFKKLFPCAEHPQVANSSLVQAAASHARMAAERQINFFLQTAESILYFWGSGPILTIKD